MEMQKIPVHIAIIPDGNRRWAREKGFIASVGHAKAGEYSHIKELVKKAEKLGVKYVSVWGFSTDNWKRDKTEINALFDIIIKDIASFRKDEEKDKIRIIHCGRKERVPENLRKELEMLEKETADSKGITLVLCLDYGGRDEIIRAINKILKSGKKEIDEKEFAEYLDTKGIPEPDLIIRTAGELRTSGFMPFQSAYAELYFVKKYFPDFSADDLAKAVKEFAKRERRFGGN